MYTQDTIQQGGYMNKPIIYLCPYYSFSCILNKKEE